jgi:uncharacterized protein YdhG (YjbR/CyaY superfamily)
MKRDASSPEAYCADVDGPERDLLEAIRRTILDEAPDLEEGIRYGMLDYPGLANLAAQKNYVALYVAPSVLDRHRENFPGVSAGKSCLRFSTSAQLDRVALRLLLRDVRKYRAATSERRPRRK